MLVIAALVAMHGAANHYRTGMTGDALLLVAVSFYLLTLAAFYGLGYGVALWLS